MNLHASILFKDVVADTDPEEVQRRLQCCANEWFYPEVTPTMPEVHVSSSPVAPPPLPAMPAPPPLPAMPAPPPLPTMPAPPVTFTPPIKFDIPGSSRLPSVENLCKRLARGELLPQPKQPARDTKPRPIFVVSDLHLGDRGPRDNFAHMNNDMRMGEFWAFLNMVEKERGQLIIVGDLFELWQSNMSLVLTSWYRLLDRLAKMGAIYVLGNHDADLLHFCPPSPYWLSHPFFETMTTSHTIYRNGQRIFFIHGHEVDSYCSGSVPGIGRITAIYTGLKEDRNGSPFLNKYRTVEAAATGRLEWVSGLLRWLLRKPNRTQVGYLGLCKILDRYDVIVSGHTHCAGQLYGKQTSGGSLTGPLPIYNAGTWAEAVCSYVAISTSGRVSVFDWINCQGRPNTTKLEVRR